MAWINSIPDYVKFIIGGIVASIAVMGSTWAIVQALPGLSRQDFLGAIPSEQYTRFVQQDRFENFLFNYFRQQQTGECLLLTFHVRTGSLATMVVGDAACQGGS